MPRCCPQEKSYWSLKLPHGWWVFGLDLALVMDIDMCQMRCAPSDVTKDLCHELQLDSCVDVSSRRPPLMGSV